MNNKLILKLKLNTIIKNKLNDYTISKDGCLVCEIYKIFKHIDLNIWFYDTSNGRLLSSVMVCSRNDIKKEIWVCSDSVYKKVGNQTIIHDTNYNKYINIMLKRMREFEL